MTKYECISSNMTCIKLGIMLGYTSFTILSHFRIYTQYLNYLALGVPMGKTVLILADENKVSEQTIYRIKWEMEAEI